ncbi:bHLH-MYC_N domain-containing protein [Cephalotus follicularis]|uniref:BHLH-MYC_N domain-containing protein n=1 Tax=Cephalotus follicularis TaxID=3775 RepID=A0A1Q3C8X5_CEPFO|nr:bHLH-MYC_N domain-containing protein [Cephalotus follicularis]
MGTTAVRQLLKSFCNISLWKYAVLWKIRHGSPMILTWEDGYCDYQKPRELMESLSGGIIRSDANETFSSHRGSMPDGGFGEYPIGLEIADMSRLQYTLGEGVVGRVAHTGSHSWSIFDNFFPGEVNCKLVSECPEEWLLQFALGIKTILLVPVLPHGVLQLGSWEVVAEDLAMVSYVKDRFSLHDAGGDSATYSLKRDIQYSYLSPSLFSEFSMENFEESSAITFSESIYEELIALDHVRSNKNRLSAINQVQPSLTVQEALQVPGEDLPEIVTFARENKIGVSPIDLIELSILRGQSVNFSQPKMVDNRLLDLSCLDEELLTYSQCNKYDGVFEESSYGIMNCYSARDMMAQPFADQDVNDKGQERIGSFLSFPNDSELHKALGPAFQGQTDLLDFSISVEDTCSSLGCICNREHISGIGPSLYVKGDEAECMLEAIVAKANSGADDTSLNISHSVKSSTSSSVKFAASSQPKSQSETSATVADGNSVPWSHMTSAFITKGGDSLTTSASFKSIVSTLIDKNPPEKACSYMHQPKKSSKLPNVSKRKARPGDNPRPRPRDRQMIQDRVKELRELVPNGAKCSIDGLLDRTVKHMLYLRSITKQAQKLEQAQKVKQWMQQEVATDQILRSSDTKNTCHKQTSWGFEFGSELQACPIVVKDLSTGHMLIEMLCKDHGFFLEIAQEIRRLDLTILKGAIESRSNNTWAHFIVEASEGFQRMDIFWPLMHLLQRKRNPISSRI